MKVLFKETNELHDAEIRLIQLEDWIYIDRFSQFNFNWKREERFLVKTIKLKEGGDEVLGLISIEDIPNEYRVHIRLLESSNSNKGKTKEYDFVAGCLIAHACEIAFEKGYDGFVSLKPKTEISGLYKDKYGFSEMGQLLFIEFNNSETLISKYLRYGKPRRI